MDGKKMKNETWCSNRRKIILSPVIWVKLFSFTVGSIIKSYHKKDKKFVTNKSVLKYCC